MIKRFLSFIKSSLDTHSKGASARKLTALWFVILVTIIHISAISFVRKAYLKDDITLVNSAVDLLKYIITADLIFIAVALGMTTVETLMKFKNGNNEPPKTPPTDGQPN